MKKVLLDLRDINHVTCGFGQIAKNYAKLYSQYQPEGIKFVFLLPKHFNETLGENIEQVNVRPKLNKHCPWTLPKVDLWHSIHQQQQTRRIYGDTKYVLTIHDLNFMTEKNRLRQLKHLLILQHRINQADAVVAISHYVAEQVKKHLNLKGRDIRVIYNGVERIDHSESCKPSFTSERPFFFTIGQIRRKKNFHILLDVMKSFPEHDLFICGDDHFDYADEIRRKIEEQQLKNVFLTGPIKQEEKVWLYKNCDAFLFPSMCEGFGLPVIEAMQFGRAVYVSNYTCLPEIGGGYAFVWEDLTTQAMTDKIKSTLPTFYDNKEQIEKEKEYAFSFSYERHIESYCKLYEKLLEK
ncbi:MAG: glycosyltransferase family 4 protein [Bacteroidaceae bacterium]|nr:glycosyltransferase family 4 protein [Bacteroidaceae bacterium]